MEKGRDCLPLPKTRRHASRHAPIVRGRYKQSWGEGKRKKREKRREKRRAEKGRERGERARRDLGQFVLYSFSIPRRLSSTLLVATFLFLRFLAEGSVPIDPPGPSKGVVVLLGVATALLLLPLSLLSCFLSPIIPFQPVRMLFFFFFFPRSAAFKKRNRRGSPNQIRKISDAAASPFPIIRGHAEAE